MIEMEGRRRGVPENMIEMERGRGGSHGNTTVIEGEWREAHENMNKRCKITSPYGKRAAGNGRTKIKSKESKTEGNTLQASNKAEKNNRQFRPAGPPTAFWTRQKKQQTTGLRRRNKTSHPRRG
jgi:hypothetical protein